MLRPRAASVLTGASSRHGLPGVAEDAVFGRPGHGEPVPATPHRNGDLRSAADTDQAGGHYELGTETPHSHLRIAVAFSDLTEKI